MMNRKTKIATEQGEQNILDHINQYGWSIMTVFDPKGEYPDFAYSIGMFDTLKSPEIVVYGLQREDATNLINKVGKFVKDGNILSTELTYTQFLDEDRPCRFIKVDQEYYKEHFGFDMWYYESWNFPVLQCVWSDEKHNFPWETAFDTSIRHFQKILGKDI